MLTYASSLMKLLFRLHKRIPQMQCAATLKIRVMLYHCIPCCAKEHSFAIARD